jgi:hypothetical protein
MRRKHTAQFRAGRVLAAALFVISVGGLLPGCSSSGIGKRASTSPDRSPDLDGGTDGAGGLGTGGAASSTTNGSGGVTGSGGIASSGGILGTGGLPSTTGVTSSAGTTFGSTTISGGTTGNGGTTTSGGTTRLGGSTSSGGAIGSGGVTTSGGATPSGGIATSGGTIISGGCACAGTTATGHFQMENLDRGVVAVKVPGGVYVGWRMFAYEYGVSGVAYNLYRDGTSVKMLVGTNNYLDPTGTATSTYAVTALIRGIEGPRSPAVTPWAQNYLRIPISPPPASPSGASYGANDGSPGDLDGDGQYDIVLKWDPSDAKENSQTGITSNVFLDGYTLAGKRLWRIDLGPNVRAGAHYTQFVVYDFDGDGKAEVAIKTAPGTKDGTGAYLGQGPAASDDDGALYRDSSGYVLTGPEYLTVFSGTDGRELYTVNFEPVRPSTAYDYDNKRGDYFLASAAFVSDGASGMAATGRPSILMTRGLFTTETITAWNWRDGKLARVWLGSAPASNGAHSLMVADTDGDGAQEIIWGSSTIASDGTKKCSTGLGLGDTLHVGDLLPARPGLEVFMVHANGALPGYDVHDAATCEVIVKGTATSTDPTNGVADDIFPNNPAAEMWSAGDTGLLSVADGSTVGPKPDSANFLVYWDADESRELEDGTAITKYGGSTLLNCAQCASNNGSKATPTLTADLLGDWREEIVWREEDNSGLRLYTTTDVTARLLYTLMHDPQYRMQVSAEQTGFNQPPHVGFPIGNAMADPPKPDIYVK